VRWRNLGLKKSKNGKIHKRYYHLQLESGVESDFKRDCFNLTGETKLKLVQYIGNHNLVVAFAHQNSKKIGAYSMTLPSTLIHLQKSCENKNPHKVYKDTINSTKSKNN
jgi:hypothetical protein